MRIIIIIIITVNIKQQQQQPFPNLHLVLTEVSWCEPKTITTTIIKLATITKKNNQQQPWESRSDHSCQVRDKR